MCFPCASAGHLSYGNVHWGALTLKGPPPSSLFFFFFVFSDVDCLTALGHWYFAQTQLTGLSLCVSRYLEPGREVWDGARGRPLDRIYCERSSFLSSAWVVPLTAETENSLGYFWSFSSKSGVGVSGSLVQGHTPGCDLICVHMSFEKAGQLPFYPFNHCLRM